MKIPPKKFLKTFLTILSILNFVSVDLVFAGEAKEKFTLEKNKNLELCKELNKIFAEPENASMFEVYEDILRRINPKEELDPELLKRRKYVFVTPEFVIPKKYKNFKLPKWEDSNAEEFLKSVSGLPENFVAAIKEGKVSEFKKSKFDLAHNGGSEVVLRFSFGKSSRQTWGCRVSEITGNDLVAKDYNPRRSYGFCFFFYYKGRIYNSDYTWDYITIREPSMLFNGGFIMPTVCTFNSK